MIRLARGLLKLLTAYRHIVYNMKELDPLCQ